MAVESWKTEDKIKLAISANMDVNSGLYDTPKCLFTSLLSSSLLSVAFSLLHVTVPKVQSWVLYSLALSSDELPLCHVFSCYLYSNISLVFLPPFYVALGSGTPWNVLNDIGQCVSISPQDGSLANFGCPESRYSSLPFGGGRSDFQ